MDNVRLHQAKISNSHARGLLASGIYGMLSGIMFSLAFIAVLALIVYKNPDPTRLILPFSYCCIVICSFLCGYSGAKFRGRNGFLSGVISGCMFSLLIFICSQFVSKSGSLPTSLVLFTYLCMILVSSLGALFACRKKKNKRKTRTRR